ncbi:hypothetical protein BGW41_003551 [Actinomortierella wolfii]|nr:hypothetical protein BGW41_003551 [Actinomortierella wolfii]
MKIPSLLLTVGASTLLLLQHQPTQGRQFSSQSIFQARSLSDETNTFQPKLVSYEPKYRGHALVRLHPEVHHHALANTQIDVLASLPSGERLARLTAEQVQILRRRDVPDTVTTDDKQIQSGPGWHIVHEDLQELIDKEAEAINRGILANHPYRRALDGPLQRGRLDYRFAQQLAFDFPHIVRFIPSIGPQRTWEGRSIFALKITSPRYKSSKAARWVRYRYRKPQVWFQGVQHAREYISVTTVQFLAHHYASRYGTDATVTSLLDRAELILILIANPDGYIHAWDHDRYWRKNKRNLGNQNFGVDTNRNWDDHWGGPGTSQDPTSEIYSGPSAASEPEVQALQGYFMREGNVVGAIDFHCYAELILRPFGWVGNETAAPHDAELANAAEGIRRAILPVHQQDFFNGRMVDVGSLAAGSAMDWFYGNSSYTPHNDYDTNKHHPPKSKVAPYGYTIELRPTLAFEDGFRLPEEQILPAGQEIAAAMDWFIDHAVENPLLRE